MFDRSDHLMVRWLNQIVAQFLECVPVNPAVMHENDIPVFLDLLFQVFPRRIPSDRWMSATKTRWISLYLSPAQNINKKAPRGSAAIATSDCFSKVSRVKIKPKVTGMMSGFSGGRDLLAKKLFIRSLSSEFASCCSPNVFDVHVNDPMAGLKRHSAFFLDGTVSMR